MELAVLRYLAIMPCKQFPSVPVSILALLRRRDGVSSPTGEARNLLASSDDEAAHFGVFNVSISFYSFMKPRILRAWATLWRGNNANISAVDYPFTCNITKNRWAGDIERAKVSHYWYQLDRLASQNITSSKHAGCLFHNEQYSEFRDPRVGSWCSIVKGLVVGKSWLRLRKAGVFLFFRL